MTLTHYNQGNVQTNQVMAGAEQHLQCFTVNAMYAIANTTRKIPTTTNVLSDAVANRKIA